MENFDPNLYSGKTLRIIPGKPLKGEIGGGSLLDLPGDKSISHRAALFASLANGKSFINNFQLSGVTIPMLRALEKVGIQWKFNDGELIVEGKGLQGYKDPEGKIECNNSATTMRLLTGAFAAAKINAVLDGSTGLRNRPMNRIIIPLQMMGVQISSENGYAPLMIKKTEDDLIGITHDLDVASAQVKSCLLLAGLTAKEETVVLEPGPSRNHTECMFNNMGISVETSRVFEDSGTKYMTRLIPPKITELRPITIIIPGDFSACAFLIVAAIITPGSEILIKDVGLNHTRTGLLDALIEMGAKIDVKNSRENGGELMGDLVVRSSRLEGISIRGDRVVRMIDEFPAFAVASAYAIGKTTVHDAIELRYKESDRISAMCNELKTIGCQVEEYPDGFSITGCAPTGGTVTPHRDHRLAMALGIAGLAAKEAVYVKNSEIISESFPDFINVLVGLGADADLII